jgi:hypothetical protein
VTTPTWIERATVTPNYFMKLRSQNRLQPAAELVLSHAWQLTYHWALLVDFLHSLPVGDLFWAMAVGVISNDKISVKMSVFIALGLRRTA